MLIIQIKLCRCFALVVLEYILEYISVHTKYFVSLYVLLELRGAVRCGIWA